MVPYSIYGPYERLISVVEDAAAQADVGYVVRNQSLGPCFQFNGDKITFECYLVLQEWKWRPKSPRERHHANSRGEVITIVVHAQEDMSKDGDSLFRSTVSLSYFLVQDGKGSLLHTVHFDYGPDSVCHPTFHAQFTDQPVIPQGDLSRDLSLPFQVVEPHLKCFGNARIPTSDMTLSSVLFCLAADHIGESFFKDFRAKVQEIQELMPKPGFEPLKSSLQIAAGHFRSSHWYAHMQ